METIQKIERMHVIDELPNGKFKVSNIDGEFTQLELDKLKALIEMETGGVHIWII